MEFANRTLLVRCKGEDVRSCQADLKKLGYELPAREIDEGYYGQQTHNSVLDFQKKNDLPASGIVNKETADMLTSKAS